MRTPTAALASLLIVISAAPALAQDRRVPQATSPLAKSQPPAAPVIRYYQTNDLLVDVWSDAQVKETRQGTRLMSAVLDVCFAPTPNSPRRDRFVVTLTPQGDKVTGSGQTVDGKQPVKIDLTRRASGDGVTLEGKITLGSAAIDVNSADNADQPEFLQSPADDDAIVAKPENFAEVSPGALALRISQTELASIVKVLRAENVRIAADSLIADCNVLRIGFQTLRFDVDPERASALLAKLKALPGVKTAGWTGSDYLFLNAVKLSGAEWRTGGKADIPKLSAAVGAALAGSIGATLEATERDATTGEVAFKLKRPSQALPELELSEKITVNALFGPEKPDSTDAVLAWISIASIDLVDEGPTPRLSLVQPRRGGDGEFIGGAVDLSVLLTAVAKGLNGQRWNSEETKWR